MRRILLILTFLCMVGSLFADEATLTITQKLSTTTGAASTTVGPLTFNFTGDKTSYQPAYVKMVPGSGVTVSIASGTITKIVVGYATDRTKSITFNANEGTWSDPTWTGSASSVTLTASSSGECSISSITVTYTATNPLTFSGDQTGVLTVLGVAVLTPTNASGTVTYSSSNTTIAQVGDNWLRFVNTGKVTIVATDANGATGTYTLTVTASDATTSISSDGKTYSVTGAGKLADKDVEDIPYISMMVGADGEAAVVREVKSGYFAISGIDGNGFSHTYSPNGVPTQGTFYTFKPTVSGSLTVTGAFEPNGNKFDAAYLYEGNNSTSIGSIAYVNDHAETSGTFNVTAGKTYYLYVPNSTETGIWDYFCLHSFTFNPSFYFENKKYVSPSGTTTYTQTVKGGDASTSYAATALNSSDLTVTYDQTSGAVSWSGNGGAILVTATDNGVSDYYVITVPYTTHKWDLSTTDLSKMEEKNTTDWALNYKVRQYDSNRTLYYINVPVVANATPIDGTNALYIPKTSGLLIKAGSKSFGAEVKTWNDNVGFDGLTLDQRLALPYTAAASTSVVTLQEGSTLTIPSLKAGQYVRLRWLRYAPYQGDLAKVTNLTDLDGTSIDNPFRIGSTSGGTTKFGYQEFIVKADGDVTITIMPEGTDRGFVNIEEIQVANKFIPTELRFFASYGKQNYNYSNGSQSSMTFYYSQAPTISLNQDRHQSSLSLDKYTVEKQDGSCSTNPAFATTPAFTDDSQGSASFTVNGNASTNPKTLANFTVSAGQGIVNVTAKAYTTTGTATTSDGTKVTLGSYALDKVTAPITILKYATTTQTYPYTWDFKKYNTSHFSNMTATTSGTTSDLWTVDNSSSKAKYTLNRNSWNCVLGDELRDANGNAVAEAQGLGFSADRKNISSLVYRTGDDISFSTGVDTIHIPTVPMDCKVYMLIKGGSSTSVVRADGTDLTGTAVESTIDVDGVKDQNNWYIYTIQGTGKTIDVALANVQLRVVAVTNAFKNFNHLDGMQYSYATEYREMAERYDLTELFSNI